MEIGCLSPTHLSNTTVCTSVTWQIMKGFMLKIAVFGFALHFEIIKEEKEEGSARSREEEL